MNYEPGDEYDCAVCGDIHAVERGKGLRVVGSSEQLDPRTYVRCPEAGVISLEEDGTEEDGTDDPRADDPRADDQQSGDWP